MLAVLLFLFSFQPLDVQRLETELQPYFDAATRHLACDDGALDIVRGLPAERLRDMTAWVQRVPPADETIGRREMDPTPLLWNARLISSMVVLHTRIALTEAERDGGHWQLHLESARTLVRRLLSMDAEVHSFLPAWYALVAAHYQAAADVFTLVSFLDDVPAPIADHWLKMLARGSMFELLASSKVTRRDHSRLGLRAEPARFDAALKNRIRKHRETAIDLFQRAARKNPRDGEAPTRLLLLLREDDGAAGASDIAGLDQLREPVLQYWAALAGGRVREQAGDASGAEQLYRRAAAMQPEAQTPSIALISLFVKTGALDRARAVARKLADRSAVTPRLTDPWTGYLSGQYWRRESLAAEMLKTVRQCRS